MIFLLRSQSDAIPYPCPSLPHTYQIRAVLWGSTYADRKGVASGDGQRCLPQASLGASAPLKRLDIDRAVNAGESTLAQALAIVAACAVGGAGVDAVGHSPD